MNSIFDYLVLGTASLTTLLVLIQTRGASLGAGFGAGGEINTVRRGADKSLHQITIVSVVAFALSAVLSVVS